MASPRARKILILSSNTGGGHRSAAAALEAGFAQFLPPQSCVVRIDNAVEESHPLSARLVRLYNWLLRHSQPSMKYYYWWVNRFRPDAAEFFYRRSIGHINRLIDGWQPDVIVSVHPLVQHIPCRALRERGLAGRVPLVTVVTDPCYGFWKGWACEGVALYFVANDDARRQLLEYGIAPERIRITGMPVHPKFSAAPSASANAEDDTRAVRRALGLDPDTFTVLANAGAEGGGNILRIFRELLRAQPQRIQAVFLAGRNAKLQTQAESLARGAGFPVKILGYSDNMEQLMRASNVMISKLGGLTVFEAFGSGLPVIADVTTPPMPQEAGTADLIVRHGAGVLLRSPAEIGAIVQRLCDDTAQYSALRAAANSLATPEATRRIVEAVAALVADGVAASSADLSAVSPAPISSPIR